MKIFKTVFLIIIKPKYIFTLLSALMLCSYITAQNTKNYDENKGYLGAGVGSILHLNDENNAFNVGISSFLEGNYSISPFVGITGQIGFNKIQVSSFDQVYLLLENSEFMIWYNSIDNNKIDSKRGMNMGYLIAGPLFTYPSGKMNFDFIPKAGLAFASPFYQYEYTIEGYSIYGYYDKDVVLYEGNYTTGFLLDIELALRTQLTDSGWGFKFFTKYIHSSFSNKMTRTNFYESRDYPSGPIEVWSCLIFP